MLYPLTKAIDLLKEVKTTNYNEGFVIIVFSQNPAFKNSSNIYLTDNIGKNILSKKIDQNKSFITLDMSNLSKGIYFISFDNHNIINKVVKQ